MTIRNSQGVGNNGRITVPAKQLFGQPAPEGSFPDTVKDVYYSKATEQTHLSAANQANADNYRSVLRQAVDRGLLSPEEAQKRVRDFSDGAVGPWNPSRPIAGEDELLATLRELEDSQFCLNRVPQQSADGLYRPVDFYTPPKALQAMAKARNWEMRPDQNGEEIPVADALVVGGGPGGLTTAWQLARRGGRVVCFEAELAGSAFSDNTAKSVHHMRTSVNLTNLVREGYFNENFTREAPLSLHGNIADYRTHARAGRDSQKELTGETIHGIPPESLDLADEHSPALRGELFEHLASLSYSLANDFEDAFLCERSPVKSVTFEDGLYTVTTTRGHQVKARHLVMATGLTGPQGEQGRMLPVFDQLAQSEPHNYTLLGKDGDSLRQAERVQSHAASAKGGMVVNDRLLGDQSVRQTIAALPEGSRAAIVGSGESAIKGALELLHLHPGLQVDLFVKEKLEVAQVQLPIENFHSAVLETTQRDHDAILAAEETYRAFGTPVTPRSVQELLEFQQQGRARLVELGEYFDEKTIALTPLGDGTTQLKFQDQVVAARVLEHSQQFRNKGLLPDSSTPVDGSNYQLFVQAVGYQKVKPQDHPLLKLPPEAHKNLHLNTSGAAIHPSQTSMPGLSTAGRRIAEQIADEIPPERRLEVPDHPRWSEVDSETVQGIIANRGLHPNYVKQVTRAIESGESRPYDAARLTFTADDTKLRELALRPSESLTPAERETLERGYLLHDKMKNYARERNS